VILHTDEKQEYRTPFHPIYMALPAYITGEERAGSGAMAA